MNRSKFSLELEDEINDDIKQVDKKAIKEFAKGAYKHETNIDKEDWRNENPDELPSYNFRLRLNKYQIGMLKHVARLEKRSMSNLIKITITRELSKKI